jgi:hypothetical protein
MPIQISGVSMGVLTGGPSSITIEDLADVSVVTPLTGQYLRYNSGISEWQNAYIDADVYDYLDGALSGTQGVSVTFTPGPNTVAIGLGAITPTSVAASGTVTGSNLSGTNTGNQTITLTGAVTGSGTGSFATTLATVNGNVGSFGSASAIPIITVNAKGLITAVSTAAIAAATATSLSGGATGSLPYQSASSTTTFLAAGTTSQVLIGGAFAPSWSSSPAGLTSVSATTFTGALTGNASTATTATTSTNIAAGTANQIPYQTGAGATAFFSAANYGLHIYGATGVPASVSGAAGVLQGSASAIPAFTTTPTLTGTNFTGIPNGGLTNSSLTLGSTSMALGSTTTTVAGLTSVTSTTFTGALTGNASTATTLATGRTIAATGDATGTSASFNGSANASIPLTLATVNANVGQFAVTTVNGKGLVTAATALTGDITSSGAATTLATVNANVGQFAVATFNAKGLATAATTLSATGDATGTSSGAGIALTLATVNGSPQADTFRKITVNGKGLTTSTSAVVASDITTALAYTPVNKNGDTMTGLLILSADPTAALGAVTKQYVDNVAAGLNVHASCITATTATLASSSAGTVTYNNGTAGVGATLTTTGSFATIGGATTANGNRILVKDEAAQANNGIYVRTSATVLTRADDFDNAPSAEIDAGDFTYIVSGTLEGTTWVQTTPAPVTVGTTSIVWTQLAGAGTYTAGTGINIASNVISNTGVLSNIAGTGISVSGATGNVTIGNTGVTNLSGTANQITMSAATGAITASLPATITGLTSVTSTTFVGALTGNASTATALQTSRTLWGQAFTGAANVTGALTSVGNITGSGAMTIASAAATTMTLNSGTTGALTVDSGTTGAVSIGNNANAKTITIGNTTGATSVVVNSGTAGVTFNQVPAGVFKVQASAAPTTDMVQFTNAGFPILTAGVNSLNVVFVGGAAAVESSAQRIDITPGATTGGTWSALRVTPTAAAATGVIQNGVKFDAITAGVGTDNALWVGTGWDNILSYNGTSIINGSGVLQNAALSGTYSGITSITSTTFVGALTGNASTATTLATGRTIAATGDATGTSAAFNGSANASIPLVLATVNANVGQFAVSTVNAKGLVTAATTLTGDITSSGAATTLATVNGSPQTDQFRKVTVNGKGLVTATSAVVAGDITPLIDATYVLKAGDTMTGSLTSPAFIPNSATVPTNGLYLPAANTIGLSTNTAVRLQINDSGNVGIGVTPATANSLSVTKIITGASTSIGIMSNGSVQSDVTGAAYGVRSSISTQAASFTLPTLAHFSVVPGTVGAGSTITNNYGFLVNSTLTGGTNNYAFAGNVATAANSWNLFMSGTADNYLAGDLGIGTSAIGTAKLRAAGSITGGTTAIGIRSGAIAASDVTSNLYGFYSDPTTAAASFNLSNLFHYRAVGLAAGAGSTIGSQYGFYADSGLTSATNNYGFYGIIAAATNSWNLYMSGTAQNYFAGNVGIGSGKTVPATALDVNGTVTATAFSGPLTGNVTGSASLNVLKAGDTMTGNLDISKNTPILALDTLASGQNAFLAYRTNGLARWNVYKSAAAESGSNAGSDYVIGRYDDAGTLINVPLVITRSTGNSVFAGSVTGLSFIPSSATVPTNGLYLPAANSVGLATNSIERLRIDSNGSLTMNAPAASGPFQHYITNTSTATNAYASLYVGNVASSINNSMAMASFGTAYTTNGGYLQDGAVIDSGSGLSGGLSIMSQGGNMRFYTGGFAAGDLAVTIGLAGNIGIGTTGIVGGYNVNNTKPITGSTNARAFTVNNAVVQSDVTSVGFGYHSQLSTTAAAFTTSLAHFGAYQGTIGAGSTVTNNYAFYADSSLIGGTNNYGFYGNIPAGTNRWNTYNQGSAQNYFSGNVGIGSGKQVPGVALDVAGGLTVVGGSNSTSSTVSLTAGTTTTSGGAGGAISLTGGAGSSSTAAGVGGAVAITAGASGNNSTGSAGGGGITITSGAGNTLNTLGVPGAITIATGAPGIAGQSGNGISILASNGFSAATNSNGGNIVITAGNGAFTSGVNGSITLSATGSAGGGGANIVAAFGTNASATFKVKSGATDKLTLDTSGNLTATGDVSAYSDARLKTNVEVIDGALGKVLAVRGVTFNKTDDEKNERHTGVIAQELQKVLPEAVREDKDGMLTVAYGNTVGLLIEAIKELNAKVETLSAELAALKG